MSNKILKQLIKESIAAEQEEIQDWMEVFAFDYDQNESDEFISDVLDEFKIDPVRDSDLFDMIQRYSEDLLAKNARFEKHDMGPGDQSKSAGLHHDYV